MLKKLREKNLKRHLEWMADRTNPSDSLSLSYRGNELAGETGEACNMIKKMERERMGLRGTRVSLEDVADELADVIICVDLLAMDLDIDMEEAVERKFNKTSRKYGLSVLFEENSSEPCTHQRATHFEDGTSYCPDCGERT